MFRQLYSLIGCLPFFGCPESDNNDFVNKSVIVVESKNKREEPHEQFDDNLEISVTSQTNMILAKKGMTAVLVDYPSFFRERLIVRLFLSSLQSSGSFLAACNADGGLPGDIYNLNVDVMINPLDTGNLQRAVSNTGKGALDFLRPIKNPFLVKSVPRLFVVQNDAKSTSVDATYQKDIAIFSEWIEKGLQEIYAGFSGITTNDGWANIMLGSASKLACDLAKGKILLVLEVESVDGRKLRMEINGIIEI